MAQIVSHSFFSWYNFTHLTQRNADPDGINFFSWGTVTNLNPVYQKSSTQVGYEFLATKDCPKIFDLWGQMLLRVAAVYKEVVSKITFIDLSVVKEVSLFGKKWKLAMSSCEGWKKFNEFDTACGNWVRACRSHDAINGNVVFYNEKGDQLPPVFNEHGQPVRPPQGMRKSDLVWLCFRQIIRHGSDFANSACDFAGLTAHFVGVKHLIHYNAIGSAFTFSGSVSNFWDDWVKLSNIDRERIGYVTDLQNLRANDQATLQKLNRNSAMTIDENMRRGWMNDCVSDIQRCNQKIAYQLLCLWMDMAYICVGSLGSLAYAGHLGYLGSYAFLTAALCPWILQFLIAGWIGSVALFVFKNYVDPYKQNQDGRLLARTVQGFNDRGALTAYFQARTALVQNQQCIDNQNLQIAQLTERVRQLEQLNQSGA